MKRELKGNFTMHLVPGNTGYSRAPYEEGTERMNIVEVDARDLGYSRAPYEEGTERQQKKI